MIPILLTLFVLRLMVPTTAVLPTSNYVPKAQSTINALKTTNAGLRDNTLEGGECSDDFQAHYVPPGTQVTFTNPKFKRSQQYRHNLNCGWWFYTDHRHDLRMRCTRMYVRPSDYFTVWNIQKDKRTVYTHLGRGSNTYFPFESDVVAIGFETDERRFWHGFKCTMQTTRTSAVRLKYRDDCTCGRVNRGRIIGGNAAGNGEYPFMAGLTTNGSFVTDVFTFCGGALISSEWVVTAAHCIDKIQFYFVPNIILGLTTKNNPFTNAILVGGKQAHVHEQFNALNLINDIAMIKIAPVTFTQYISPICPQQDLTANLNGRDSRIIGWGTDSSGNVPRTLQEVVGTIFTRSACQSNPAIKYEDSLILSTMFCAGRVTGGIDSCQGDSGGPVFIEEGGAAQLIGLTSWGFGCAENGHPGVYTNVTSLLLWVTEKMGDSLFCKPPSA